MKCTAGIALALGLVATSGCAPKVSGDTGTTRVVRIDSGPVEGVPVPGTSVTVFQGLPYAAPPAFGLRWRPPQAVAKWEAVRRADRFGPVCMQ
jgi:hypothetical protein